MSARLWRGRLGVRFPDILHRCQCCHTRNRSVSFWPFKGNNWLCGECAYGLCDFDCNGTPYRRRERRGYER